jgi:hypothetical protein
MFEEPWFDPREGQEMCVFSKEFRLVLGPNQPASCSMDTERSFSGSEAARA